MDCRIDINHNFSLYIESDAPHISTKLFKFNGKGYNSSNKTSYESINVAQSSGIYATNGRTNRWRTEERETPNSFTLGKWTVERETPNSFTLGKWTVKRETPNSFTLGKWTVEQELPIVLH